MVRLNRRALCALAGVALSVSGSQAVDAASIGTDFAGSYQLAPLGSVAGVPASYGGITFKAGDANTLLLGGAANGANGAIYSVPVTRDAGGHIVSFGTASFFASAPNIDGGLAYGPGGVLFYTGYSNNILGQIKPGSTSPDKIINLSLNGVSASVGTVQFVPSGFDGAGEMRIMSYSGGGYYAASLTPDGSGTYDVTQTALLATTGGGPEGLVFVDAGNPLFSTQSILVSEYGLGRVSAYTLDANGAPDLALRRTFVSNLTGAEGAVIDPLTGDFIFSTFGSSNQIVRVSGFNAPAVVPVPASAVAMPVLLGGLALARRFRKPR